MQKQRSTARIAVFDLFLFDVNHFFTSLNEIFAAVSNLHLGPFVYFAKI